MNKDPVEVDGVVYESRVAVAKAYGVPVTTFFRRLSAGMSPAEAVKAKPLGKTEIVIEGKTFASIKDASVFYSVNYGALIARLNKGWPLEQAVGIAPRERPKTRFNRGKPVVVGGVTYVSVNEAARQYGFNFSCIARRRANGLTLDQAFEIEPFPEWFTPGKGKFAAKKRKERVEAEKASGLRRCCRCKQHLPLSHFSKYSTKDDWNYYGHCKECTAHAFLMYRYNITIQDFTKIAEYQGWKCAICLEPLKMEKGKIKRSKAVAVDHCHATGKVRGLLCSGCNNGIGLFRDSISNLENAIKYLQSPPAAIA